MRLLSGQVDEAQGALLVASLLTLHLARHRDEARRGTATRAVGLDVVTGSLQAGMALVQSSKTSIVATATPTSGVRAVETAAATPDSPSLPGAAMDAEDPSTVKAEVTEPQVFTGTHSKETMGKSEVRLACAGLNPRPRPAMLTEPSLCMTAHGRRHPRSLRGPRPASPPTCRPTNQRASSR